MSGKIGDIIREGKSESASEKQKKEFFALFHQPEAEKELKDIMLEDLAQTEPVSFDKPQSEKIFTRFWTSRKRIENSQRRKLFIQISRVAAVLVLGLTLGYFMAQTKQEAGQTIISKAPKGSISEMYLPDGSHIFLNSGSEIKYTADGSSSMREVFLSGEAWFEVSKNKKKPFVVHTSSYDVEVTGTSFNVKSYQEDDVVTTTLEEGSIIVKSSENFKLAKEVELKPGEQLVFNKELRNVGVKAVNAKWYTSWKENKLVFVDMSLEELVVLLERKFGVEIEVVDKSILAYHYNGTIKNETILQVMEILNHTMPIQYQIIDQKVVIKKNKDMK